MEYASTLSAAIVTPSQPFEGASVVWFPRSENPIIAGTMVSPQRSVDGQYLITAAFHDEAAKEYISMPYEKQKEALDRGLSHFLPDDYEVLGIQKWHDAIPMFKPGHIKRIVEFEKRLLDENDMIYYAGDTYGGPYIEGAILSGIKAADLMINNI